MSDYLSDYEDYLKTEKHASANTVSSYLRDVHQFIRAMEEQDIPLAQVESAQVSHEAGTAVVTLSGEVANDVLKKAVEDQDYPVTSIQ